MTATHHTFSCILLDTGHLSPAPSPAVSPVSEFPLVVQADTAEAKDALAAKSPRLSTAITMPGLLASIEASEMTAANKRTAEARAEMLLAAVLEEELLDSWAVTPGGTTTFHFKIKNHGFDLEITC